MSWLKFGKGEPVEKDEKVDLSSPWIGYARMIYALFGKDPEIDMEYDADGPAVKLFVSDAGKAEAIAQLLPASKDFGNVTLSITVIPPNAMRKDVLLEKAFDGNPIFSKAVYVDGVFSNPVTYVAFKPNVVQYFNDDLGSLDGVTSVLYEDVARDILQPGDGVLYYTEAGEDAIIWP